MKTKNIAQKSQITARYKKAIVVAVIVCVLIGLYGLAEAMYQGEVGAMRNGLDKAKTDVVVPKGGSVKSSATVTHGAHLFDKIGCIDTNCPQVEATWQVPFAASEIAPFKTSIVAAIKSRQANDMFFDRSKWQVNVSTSAANDVQNAAPAGKEWQIVHVFVTE